MDDLLHDTPDVTIAFRKVERTELSGVLVVVCVRLELNAPNPSSVHAPAIKIQERRTMVCDRLCARMTLPIVESAKKKLSALSQETAKVRGSRGRRIQTSQHASSRILHQFQRRFRATTSWCIQTACQTSYKSNSGDVTHIVNGQKRLVDGVAVSSVWSLVCPPSRSHHVMRLSAKMAIRKSERVRVNSRNSFVQVTILEIYLG